MCAGFCEGYPVRTFPRILFLALGHCFVAIGFVGAFVPVLPTTPFLLLAAACYLRGSEKHHQWLMNSPVFGPVLRDYQEKRAITIKTKAVALSVMWASLLFSVYRVQNPALDYMLLGIGVCLSIVLLRIPTLRQENPEQT